MRRGRFFIISAVQFFSSRLLVAFVLLGAPLGAVAAPGTKPVAPKTTKAPFKDPLAIPAFAGLPVEFLFEGTQKDLLGVLQGLARGAKVEGAKPASPGTGGADQLFSDAELLDMVSEIHVLRAFAVVLWQG